MRRMDKPGSHFTMHISDILLHATCTLMKLTAYIHPSAPQTAIFWEIQVNTMGVDALPPLVAASHGIDYAWQTDTCLPSASNDFKHLRHLSNENMKVSIYISTSPKVKSARLINSRIITVASWWARWRLKSPASRLFTQSFIQAQIKENIKKIRVTGLCAGNSSVTDEFPTQMASNAGNVSIWWRHHVMRIIQPMLLWTSSDTYNGPRSCSARIWPEGTRIPNPQAAMKNAHNAYNGRDYVSIVQRRFHA